MRSFIQLTAMSARNSNTQSPMNNLILCHVLTGFSTSLVLVYVILDLYGVGHEFVNVAHDGVRLGCRHPSGGRKIVPSLLYDGIALDVNQHAVMLDYAVVLPGVLPVNLSLVHAVTSYAGVCAVVIDCVICG